MYAIRSYYEAAGGKNNEHDNKGNKASGQMVALSNGLGKMEGKEKND